MWVTAKLLTRTEYQSWWCIEHFAGSGCCECISGCSRGWQNGEREGRKGAQDGGIGFARHRGNRLHDGSMGCNFRWRSVVFGGRSGDGGCRRGWDSGCGCLSCASFWVLLGWCARWTGAMRCPLPL